MIKPLTLLFSAVLLVSGSFAQAPARINYQAVARNAGGQALPNTSLAVRFNIRSGSALGPVTYSESHNVTTDGNGLFAVHIGNGAVNTGSFTAITWGTNSYWLQVEMDLGGGLVDMGTQQFVSVPFALHAETARQAWGLAGNTGTNPTTDFIGTVDPQPLSFKVNNTMAGKLDYNILKLNTSYGVRSLQDLTSGVNNTAIGYVTLGNCSTGSNNTALGTQSLRSLTTASHCTALGTQALEMNTTGARNTGVGHHGLNLNSTGSDNTALGYAALEANSTGSENTGLGSTVLRANTTGYANTAIGFATLDQNTTGFRNSAVGHSSLGSNGSGSRNTAIGWVALGANTSGADNTACGSSALQNNTVGIRNTAVGESAQRENISGNNNVSIGYSALLNNTTTSNNVVIGNYAAVGVNSGGDNVAIGANAMYLANHGQSNVAVGRNALYLSQNGFDNTAVGADAGTLIGAGHGNVCIGKDAGGGNSNGSNHTAVGHGAGTSTDLLQTTTALGYMATATGTDQVRIGTTTVASIGGYKAWSNLSDARFKTNVEQNVPGLAFIMKLAPVTYQLDVSGLNRKLGLKDDAFDEASLTRAEGVRCTGFLAQDVEQAARELDFDFSGVDAPRNENDLYALRYAEFVVPLVKAVQEQQAMIERQQLEIDRLTTIVQGFQKP